MPQNLSFKKPLRCIASRLGTPRPARDCTAPASRASSPHAGRLWPLWQSHGKASPLLSDGWDNAWVFMHHFALRARPCRKFFNAAQLAGFADAIHCRQRNAALQQNDTRAQARLHALLRERLAPGQLERLLAEGTKLTEDEACRLALAD